MGNGIASFHVCAQQHGFSDFSRFTGTFTEKAVATISGNLERQVQKRYLN